MIRIKLFLFRVRFEQDIVHACDSQKPRLHLQSSATTEQIRKAYRLQALHVHPDKINIPSGSTEEDLQKLRQEATLEFQDLSRFYAVLSDPVKRAAYDQTGVINDGDVAEGASLWSEYFEAVWNGVVNEDSINKYAVEYRYSDKEREDVLDAYLQSKGSLLDMIDIVPLSSFEDLARFKDIVQHALDDGSVSTTFPDSFPIIDEMDLKRRKAALKKEEKEAAKASLESKQKAKKELSATNSADSEKDLALLIRSKNQGRMESLLAKLEDKYGESDIPQKTRKSKDSQKRDIPQSLSGNRVSKRISRSAKK